MKRTGKVTRERTKFRGKIIPNRGTHNREVIDIAIFVTLVSLQTLHLNGSVILFS